MDVGGDQEEKEDIQKAQNSINLRDGDISCIFSKEKEKEKKKRV
jgi:hypothetical protein